MVMQRQELCVFIFLDQCTILLLSLVETDRCLCPEVLQWACDCNKCHDLTAFMHSRSDTPKFSFLLSFLSVAFFAILSYYCSFVSRFYLSCLPLLYVTSVFISWSLFNLSFSLSLSFSSLGSSFIIFAVCPSPSSFSYFLFLFIFFS